MSEMGGGSSETGGVSETGSSGAESGFAETGSGKSEGAITEIGAVDGEHTAAPSPVTELPGGKTSNGMTEVAPGIMADLSLEHSRSGMKETAPGIMAEAGNGNVELSENPASIEQAQKEVESFYTTSLQQILQENGQYISKESMERIQKGLESIKAVPHDPMTGRYAGYRFHNGKSSIEVSAIDRTQMERSTKHETFHFTSFNRELRVPNAAQEGYQVYNTVGTRQSSWLENSRGEFFQYQSHGSGLNEGLTTMYTNEALMAISKEKGEAAIREGIYGTTTELCTQLESIVGKDALKEAYFSGNIKGLEAKVEALAGEKSFENLRDCLDRTLSKDYVERILATKDAQAILAKMSKASKGGKNT